VKTLLITLISILSLSSLLYGQKTGTLYKYETSLGFVWKSVGSKALQPKYEGEIKNDNPNGFGFVTYPYEDKNILGEWKEGKQWNTKHTKKDGTLIGKFENGKWKLMLGLLFIGERDGKFGYFTEKWKGLENEENKDIGKYEGEIKNGSPNGQGNFTLNNGEKYVGEFKDGKSHGQGTYTFKKGNKYVGGWKDGKRSGQGTVTWSDSKTYIGEWENGKYNGKGTLILPNGEKYVGEWKDGEKDGQGTFIFQDGSKYVGEWKDGEKNGQGTFIFQDGEKYVGEWKDGEKNGQGTYAWSIGDKFTGEYQDNKRWNGIYYDQNGNIIGKYVNGKEVKQ
jgi:hypothetical protein